MKRALLAIGGVALVALGAGAAIAAPELLPQVEPDTSSGAWAEIALEVSAAADDSAEADYEQQQHLRTIGCIATWNSGPNFGVDDLQRAYRPGGVYVIVSNDATFTDKCHVQLSYSDTGDTAQYREASAGAGSTYVRCGYPCQGDRTTGPTNAMALPTGGLAPK